MLDTLLTHPLATRLWPLFPHLPDLLCQWENRPLRDIATAFAVTGKASAAARRVLTDMTRTALGPETAHALDFRLRHCPAVLSANYHGIECFPEMVQAIHFFALNDLTSPPVRNPAVQVTQRVVPILSCSSVSLQSATYPRGLMLSRRNPRTMVPVHLPLFPSAHQNVMISQAPPLTARTKNLMERWWTNSAHELEPWEREAVMSIAEAHLLRPCVLDLPSFSAQVTRINESLCRKRYPEADHVRIVYLDMEGAVRTLLKADLLDANSVVYRVLFQPDIRRRILDALTGVRGCWQRDAAAGDTLRRTGSAGTIFFWTVDNKGRRCPLTLRPPTGQEPAALEYQTTRFLLRPESILAALEAGQLVPSLFTVYTSLTLDHGLQCFGGIFLSRYLPTMIENVVQALAESAPPLPPLLAALPLGFQVRAGQTLRPAGAVELHAAGGLSRAQLDHFAQLRIPELLPLSLREWVLDYMPDNKRPSNWSAQLLELASRWRGIILEIDTPRAANR